MMKNTVFNYDKKEIIGLVNSVDTGMSTAVINDDSTLSQLQVNQLLAVQSPKSGRFIIAMIIKIYRKASNIDDEEETEYGAALATFNQVRLVFVGEFIVGNSLYAVNQSFIRHPTPTLQHEGC